MKNSKKFITSAVAITVAASAIAPVASAASFSDIKGNAHENAIISLAGQGIIGGYPDGTFKPNQNLTRSDVVKLLGKYLVSLGHEIPTDYKTKMRFTDLTAKSQDELLQYAALVKDVGVFQGSNGALMHRDQLRRDQMATVLVRAFKVITEYDYVAPMNDADYKATITDLSRTSVEHQESIKTLAYHGVTKQSTFSPKDPTKRGQFASFLYNMLLVEVPKPAPIEPEKPVLTIKTVEVQAADKLRVVLSDDKAYIVTLKTPLVDNVETEVTFDINGQSFATKVKYVVPDLKVATVTNLNAGQFVITFNQQLKLSAELKADEINKLVNITGIDKIGRIVLLKAQLSEDKRSLTVTTNGLTALEGRYHIVVASMESVTAHKLVKFDDVVTFTADKTAPTIAKVETVSATKVKAIFSEPIKKSYGALNYTLANGTPVLNVKESALDNVTEVEFDLSAATANGRILDPGTTIFVSFPTILDVANNLSSPNPLTTYISKGNKDGVAPTITNVTQLGAKKVKLTFTEPVRLPIASDLAIAQGNVNYVIEKIEQDTVDTKSVIVTTTNHLSGYTTIATAPGRYITDLSGEINVFSTAYNFVVDTNVPNVIGTSVVRDQGTEYLEFTFDRNIEAPIGSKVQITGSYIYNSFTYPITENLVADIHKSTKLDNVARVQLKGLLNETNFKNYVNHTFLVNASFIGVRSEHGQNVNNVNNVTFTRGYDALETSDLLVVSNVETSTFPTINNTIDKNTIVVTFNTNVDPSLASNVNNYSIAGIKIENANVKFNEPNKVYLTIQPGSIVNQRSENLYISNLRATNSTVMMAPYAKIIPFNENITPKISKVVSNSANTIVVTFSEPVLNVLSSSFDVNVNGTKALDTIVYPVTNTTEYMIVVPSGLRATDSVTLSLTNNSLITDSAGNSLDYLSPVLVPVLY